MTLKVLNSNNNVASTENVVAYVYAHDNFVPKTGANISVSVYSGSTSVGATALEESYFVDGVYSLDIDATLSQLAVGGYSLVLFEGATESGIFYVNKKADMNKAEYAAVDSKKITSNYANEDEEYRNIVVGAVESITVETKSYSASGVNSPVVSGEVYFHYRNPSMYSDYTLSTGIVEKVVVPVYSESFESLLWVNSVFGETFEDDTWEFGAFVEDFEHLSWA